jgi:hypothetical protein
MTQSVPRSTKREGLVSEHITVRRGCADGAAAAARVSFRQMAPSCLAPDLGSFDVVVVTGVLDRCVAPRAPLGRMGGVHPLVKPGGTQQPPPCTCYIRDMSLR